MRVMHPKVSIVVPIYNVDCYLCCCIDSLISQSLEEIEIILVDDGSTDRSGVIADDYAAKDSRIRVFHQRNAGLGPARNTGIDHASGEYVGFVDSDDWVDSGMYANLYAAARHHNADIVFGGHRDMVENRVRIVKQHPLAHNVLRGSEDISHVRDRLFGHALNDTSVESFPMRVWTAIYRNRMVQDKGLRFEEILSEDTIFNLAAYRAASVVVFTDDTQYFYRLDNQSSIMRSFSPDKLARYEGFISRLWSVAEQEGNDCDEQLMRVRRTAIDYCRLYAELIIKAKISIGDKFSNIHKLSNSKMCLQYSTKYPLDTLPIQQRVFHKALLRDKAWKVLLLAWARHILKNKVWK